LPELLADVPDPRIFLKMDTQGFDLEVFAGVGKYLEKIVGLQAAMQSLSALPAVIGVVARRYSPRRPGEIMHQLLAEALAARKRS
jgi:hypothetical protein